MAAVHNRKEIVQILKYLLAGLSITIVQFVLVNLFPFVFASWKSQLPPILSVVFSEKTMGSGNSNWGYVMTFFLSNLIANIYGYFLNRRTVFHSDSPLWCFIAFLVMMASLILVSTWLQGLIANAVSEKSSSLSAFANTIAAAVCAFGQNLIVYPTEKFILLREKKSQR